MASNEIISYKPTDGLSYDPNEKKYWDEELLNKEIERVFEVCHGCRMCFKYCDSFPTLFDLLDAKYDGDVRKINHIETKQIFDYCFQCKLCEVQCPYTPRDQHEYKLDFPKLVHRYKAIQHQKGESSLRDKMLAEPDLVGRASRASFGLANKMNKVKLHRQFMDSLVGIHKDKNLPDFANETFESWAEKNEKIKNNETVDAVLFQTCFVQNNEPQIGKDTITILEKNNVNYTCLKGFKCCGMPNWETGDLESLQKKARHNLQLLKPYIKQKAKVLVINPTCAMMMRREYVELVAEQDRPLAQELSVLIRDTSEYLHSLNPSNQFNEDFKSSPREVAYHAPCHLRAQAIGFKGRDLVKKLPNTEVKMVMECCGHDGTYAMKSESYENSIKVGKRSFEQMKSHNAETWMTECPLAATQLEQHGGKKALHPMTVLAKAYKGESFD